LRAEKKRHEIKSPTRLKVWWVLGGCFEEGPASPTHGHAMGRVLKRELIGLLVFQKIEARGRRSENRTKREVRKVADKILS